MGCSNVKQEETSAPSKMLDLKKEEATIIFVNGGPGAGKGTQCGKLVEAYGFSHLSSGDLLRNELKNGGELASQIEQIQKEGGLVDSTIVVNLIKQEILKNNRGVYLIDGFPRNQENIDVWARVMGDHLKPACLLFFECTLEVMSARMFERSKVSGRSDDNPETIQKRLDTYLHETTPLLAHFQAKDQLVKIVADGTIEDIFADVRSRVEQKGLHLLQPTTN